MSSDQNSDPFWYSITIFNEEVILFYTNLCAVLGIEPSTSALSYRSSLYFYSKTGFC